MDLSSPTTPSREPSLPSLTLYRRNCYAQLNSAHLAYLSSTTELKLIQFMATSSLKIVSNKKVELPLEPVKYVSLKMHKDGLYVAVVTITKILIFFGNQLFYEALLKINTNIVQFEDGFMGAKQWQNGFIFVTRHGHLHIFDINTKDRTIKTPSEPAISPYCSIAVRAPLLYLGTESGTICLITVSQSQSYSIAAKIDTTSKLPILTLLVSPSSPIEIYGGTCEGELVILDEKLTQLSCIAVHRGLISRLLLTCDGKEVFTVGEDQQVKKFQIQSPGERKVRFIKQWTFDKIVSMILEISNKVYISYYETPKLVLL